MRRVIRFLGLTVLAAAIAAAANDARTSFGTGAIRIAKLGDWWAYLNRTSLLLLQPAIERHIEPIIGQWLWDPVILAILTAPAWLVLAVIGAGLMVLGRHGHRRTANRGGNGGGGRGE